MFDIDQTPTFLELVTVRVPNGLGSIEQSFTGLFAALDVPELDTFDLSKPDDTKRFCERVWIGAIELVSGKDPVEFDAGIRDRLIAKAWVRTALVDAYVAGLKRAAAGN
jgi:hypothetical protein